MLIPLGDECSVPPGTRINQTFNLATLLGTRPIGQARSRRRDDLQNLAQPARKTDVGLIFQPISSRQAGFFWRGGIPGTRGGDDQERGGLGTLRPLLQPERRSCSRLAAAIITAGTSASGDRPGPAASFSLTRLAHEAASDTSPRRAESLFARHSRGYGARAHAPGSTSGTAQGISGEYRCSRSGRDCGSSLRTAKNAGCAPLVVSLPTGSRFLSRSSRLPTMSRNRAPAAPRAQDRPPRGTPGEVLRGL